MQLLQTWINIRANQYGWWHARSYQLDKNTILFFEYCTKTFHLLLNSSFSLKQTKLLNSTYCSSNNFLHNLFTFLLFDILCILEVFFLLLFLFLEFIQWLYPFLKELVKLWWGKCLFFFEGLPLQNVLIMFLFSIKL